MTCIANTLTADVCSSCSDTISSARMLSNKSNKVFVLGSRNNENPVRESNKKTVFGFEWSFKPLIFLIQSLTGTELFEKADNSHPCFKWFFLFYRPFLLITAIIFTVLSIRFIIVLMNDYHDDVIENENHSKQKAKMDILSTYLDSICSLMASILAQLTIFCISFTKHWKQLWDCLKQLETQLNLGYNFFKKIKHMVMFSFLILILVTRFCKS